MKHSYRITKYFQKNEDGFLTCPESEWTSFHDIGTKTTTHDYMRVEDAYVRTIFSVCTFLNISALQMQEIEIHNKNMPILYVEGAWITISNSASLVRMILREELWCKLKSPTCEFHFGYDYYMYCVANIDLSDIIYSISPLLNVEKFTSPYLTTAG